MIDLKLLLQEEKSLGKNPYFSYKLSSLKEIDSSIIAMKKIETKENLRQDAIDMSFDNPDSIVLNFVAGRINLLLNPHEAQVRLNNLMNTFHDKRNFECAEYIATTILDAYEAPVALRVLGEIAETKQDYENMWLYYERYVKCNSDDTEIIVKLADHYQENDELKNARNYYQRSLNRLIGKNENSKIKTVFQKLLDNATSDFSFYFAYLSKLSSSDLALDLNNLLLSNLLKEKESFDAETPLSTKRKNIENIIEVCRNILLLDEHDYDIREKLSLVLKERYSKNSRYEECAAKFDITKQNNDPVKALDDFQKNIAYSKNIYVIQNATKRVGLIVDVDTNSFLTVKFSSRPSDEVRISIPNAMVSFTCLSNKDIRAIKKGKKSDVIKNKIMGEDGAEWLLKTMLISSNGKTCQIKDMKEEVVPSILNEKEWNEISKVIKLKALDDPYIDVINKNTFHLRDYPSTKEERVYETFVGYKDFAKKVNCIMDASDFDNMDLASDSFLDMVKYFSDYLSDDRNTISTRIESLLVIEGLGKKGLPVVSEYSFSELYSPLSLNDKKNVYEELSCKANKTTYLDLITSVDKKAYDVLEAIFPVNPTKELMKKMNAVNSKKFIDYQSRVINDYKNNLIAYCFFIESGLSSTDLKNLKISEDQFIETELNALSFLFSSFADDRQRKALRNDLIDKKRLSDYLKKAKEENIIKLSSYLIWNEGLTEEEKDEYKKAILSRFPSFNFGEKEEKEEVVEISVMRGFMCTKESFNRKQAELKDIKEVQIPQTLHEISTARELGDLRENSEYQYAKDHKVFLDREYERLANELSSVKIMSVKDVIDNRVGFGTRVTILDTKDKNKKTYTFLGRWESDPDNNIIDINAPIGQALINHIEGDVVDYKNGSYNTQYKVEKIEKIDF